MTVFTLLLHVQLEPMPWPEIENTICCQTCCPREGSHGIGHAPPPHLHHGQSFLCLKLLYGGTFFSLSKKANAKR